MTTETAGLRYETIDQQGQFDVARDHIELLKLSLETYALSTLPGLIDPFGALGKGLELGKNHEYETFYALGGVQPTPLLRFQGATNGHRMYIKDETKHEVSFTTCPADGSKGETMQFETGAFKRRGAWWRTVQAVQSNPDCEYLAAASHGNHAINTIVAAALLRKKSIVFLPEDTDPARRLFIESLGAQVRYKGYATFEDAQVGCQDVGLAPNVEVVEPFDDPAVITGQGTMLLEIVADLYEAQSRGEIDLQTDDIYVTMAAAGGGGVSGLALAAQTLRNLGVVGTNLKIIAAELEGDNAVQQSVRDYRQGGPGLANFEGGKNHHSESTDVQQCGRHTLGVLADERYVDDIIVVGEAETGVSMREMTANVGRRVEPPAGIAMAAGHEIAARLGKPSATGERPAHIVVIACGARESAENYAYFMEQAKQSTTFELQQIGKLACQESLDDYLERLKNPLGQY